MHTFPTYQHLKEDVAFFYLVYNLSYLPKSKIPDFYTLTETSFINSHDLNKKNPSHSFVDIRKMETCAKFQQKIVNSTVVGARHFLDK